MITKVAVIIFPFNMGKCSAHLFNEKRIAFSQITYQREIGEVFGKKYNDLQLCSYNMSEMEDLNTEISNSIN